MELLLSLIKLGVKQKEIDYIKFLVLVSYIFWGKIIEKYSYFNNTFLSNDIEKSDYYDVVRKANQLTCYILKYK